MGTGGDRDERGAGRARPTPSSSTVDGDGDPGERVVAVAAGGLERTRVRVPRRERGRTARPRRARRGASVVSSGPTKKSAAAISRVARAARRPRRRRRSSEHRGHLAGRVGVHDRADRGAAVADRRVGDVAQCLAQQRERGVRRRRRARAPACRTSAPTRTARVGDVDGIQPGDAVDVDEVRRGGEPHVEHRHQALPAGEHLAVVADLGRARRRPRRRCGVRGARTVRASPGRSCLLEGLGKGTAPPGRSWPRAGRSAVRVAGRRAGGSGARSRSGSRSPGGAGVALLVEVVDAVAVAVDVVTHGDRGAVGLVAQLRRGRWRGPGGSRRSSTIVPSAMPLEREVVGELQLDVSPMPMMMPAATGTRLIGLPKSTPFSFQIFAPSRPIMP